MAAGSITQKSHCRPHKPHDSLKDAAPCSAVTNLRNPSRPRSGPAQHSAHNRSLPHRPVYSSPGAKINCADERVNSQDYWDAASLPIPTNKSTHLQPRRSPKFLGSPFFKWNGAGLKNHSRFPFLQNGKWVFSVSPKTSEKAGAARLSADCVCCYRKTGEVETCV